VEQAILKSESQEVLFCSRCTLSNQRPRVVFDRETVCNACRYSERKGQIDWTSREQQLIELLERHRSRAADFDVVVPCSGGKDGGFVAHQLKHKYGMRVLAVTWSPLRYTEIGRQNLDSFINSGFDHILGTANPNVLAKLARDSFVEMGDPFQPFIYGQTNFPIQVAKSYGVNLIMYGENGEVEYGGDQSLAESPLKEMSEASYHYFSGKDVSFWQSKGYSEQDLRFFSPPGNVAGIEQHFFGYYKRWDPQENYYYATEHLGFQANTERSEGTYSKYASLDDRFDGFHYYMGFIKFGVGRATSDTAHEIRDGKITRDEGTELVRKFDGEFPAKYFEEFLDYCDMTEEFFEKVVDSWRSPHIWKKYKGMWELRSKIWESR
jgi:N-acetyl sugar amidotransferase